MGTDDRTAGQTGPTGPSTGPTTGPTTQLDAAAAAEALAEVRRRGDQTRAAATAPWPAAAVVPVAASFLPLGYLIDIDMVWAFAVAVGVTVALAGRRAVQLRAADRDGRRDLLLLASFVLALLVDIAVQAVVRGADLPLPNTWGAAGAAAVVLAVSWPLQRRTAFVAPDDAPAGPVVGSAA